MAGRRGEVLVAIMNKQLDMNIARDQHWYRIPVTSVESRLKKRWPPRWLAFYQTKIFGDEKYSIRYYAEVIDIKKVFRYQLFQDQPNDEKYNKQYCQLILSPLKLLPQPIKSRRWRRIIFIPTTWEKFITAEEINDLYDDSPLEDKLWKAFKQTKIHAERQLMVQSEEQFYFLDFALFCALGNIDVETDGDTWHSDPKRIPLDNQRQNELETLGWRTLRFNTKQIIEELDEYCVHKVVENINKLGGLEVGKFMPRRIDLKARGLGQLSLFDVIADEDRDLDDLQEMSG